MGARDPVIDEDDYLKEAMEAMSLALPEGRPGSWLCFAVFAALLKLLDRKPLHQSDLDELYEAFDDAVEGMKA
jgi:hypothetical protein